MAIGYFPAQYMPARYWATDYFPDAPLTVDVPNVPARCKVVLQGSAGRIITSPVTNVATIVVPSDRSAAAVIR